MKKLSELIKEVNKENAPPDGWKKEDTLKGTVICKAKKCENYLYKNCLLYTSPSPRDGLLSRMPSSA